MCRFAQDMSQQTHCILKHNAVPSYRHGVPLLSRWSLIDISFVFAAPCQCTDEVNKGDTHGFGNSKLLFTHSWCLPHNWTKTTNAVHHPLPPGSKLAFTPHNEVTFIVRAGSKLPHRIVAVNHIQRVPRLKHSQPAAARGKISATQPLPSGMQDPIQGIGRQNKFR